MRDTQIPREALPWLLAAQAGSLVLHISHLPLWMWLLAAAVAGWRWLIHSGRVAYPGRRLKALAVVAASAGVILTFWRSFALESATAFLVAAALLKLLEMRYRRDGYVVVFLSCFVLAVGFLFHQDILAGLYGLLCVWLLMSALLALHRHFSSARQAKRSVQRQAGTILLVSLPLMLVLYFLFPRLSPLWGFNLHSGEARTGLSETMAPGDIARLGQSDELAFRVTFTDGRIPPRQELYWRALVLDQYDGRQWKPFAPPAAIDWYRAAPAAVIDDRSLYAYEIIQEPTGKRWLFALRGVSAAEAGTGVTDQGMLVSRRPVHNRIRYRAQSWPATPLQAEGLTAVGQRLALSLPRSVNPQSRAFAAQLRQEHSSDEDFIQTLLSYFRDNAFYYTLKPDVLGSNDIDEFLFSSRRGFCAHYAGALVFLARSAGIPARVVAGYQGGEWNAEEGYLTVRQYDAHAWAEVWLAGQGWVRVDPTAAVAPERIEYGLEQAVADEGSFLEDQVFSAQKLKGINWLNRLRLEFDSLNYYWQRWVLAYDGERQKGFLSGVLGLKDYKTGLVLLGSSFFVFFLLASVVLWWKSRPPAQSPFMRAWRLLQQRGARAGVVAMGSDTPSVYLQRLAEQQPLIRDELLQLRQDINQLLYQQDDAQRLAGLVRRLRRLAKRIK